MIKNYDGMYELLSSSSKSSISKEDFITKNKNIYEGIDSLDIKIDIKETKKKVKILKYYIMSKCILQREK